MLHEDDSPFKELSAWRKVSILVAVLQKLIRSVAGASEYSLLVLSRLLELFKRIVYRVEKAQKSKRAENITV